jgi:hypothetical protein
MGRAGPLCTGTSDIHLFSYCKRVIDFDSEVATHVFSPYAQAAVGRFGDFLFAYRSGLLWCGAGNASRTCLHPARRSRSTCPVAVRIAGCLLFRSGFRGPEKGRVSMHAFFVIFISGLIVAGKREFQTAMLAPGAQSEKTGEQLARSARVQHPISTVNSRDRI